MPLPGAKPSLMPVLIPKKKSSVAMYPSARPSQSPTFSLSSAMMAGRTVKLPRQHSGAGCCFKHAGVPANLWKALTGNYHSRFLLMVMCNDFIDCKAIDSEKIATRIRRKRTGRPCRWGQR